MPSKAEVAALTAQEYPHGVEREIRPDRLPGDLRLRGPEAEEAREEPRGRRPRDPRDVREARDPAPGTGAPRGGRRRRGPRQRVRRDDVQEPPQGPRDYLRLLLRGRRSIPTSSGSGSGP